MSIDDSSDISNIKCDTTSTDYSTDYPNSSLTTEDKSSSIRLLELEELLQGLKDKFTSLEGNEPMKNPHYCARILEYKTNFKRV